ncbi:aldehyde dehydrogenase family protein [Fimbriimonas ginsengisoli]|uniref:Putative aldehyde dehydrogenase (NAD) n=1 Tax=Fimbriimonas ginsengisoli Gsoil 348 TaxID=661478 RepID=A0A068NX09_FIMGI|nr:aldehyde dehydrogenase family protein [Fimbriimonas ginsengisoli]AIE87902.1 putative aldehyde dehydrogenase (NAD) [Fimbriimonas ginsengisoli Gsoil 348]
MQPIHAKNYIDGQWQEAGQVFESLNPANRRETVGTAPLSQAADADQAVASAKHAFESWRELSWVKRAEYIDAFAQLIRRDIEEIAALVTRECGKPLNEGRADAVEALHMAQYVAGLGRMPNGYTVSSEISAKDAFILRKPKGVIACITPWNFPSAIPTWVILPSILAGNTVVFKPAEQTPIVAHKLMELFHEAGLPAGVVNLVHGTGEDVGDPLVKHKDVAGILFTGSRAVGKYIQQVAAGDAYKFVATEMGGKNGTIVLEDADLDIAVNACVLGAFKTSGQRCVSTSRIIVDRKLEPEFTRRYVENVKRIKVGNGMQDDIFMGPLIEEGGIEKWKLHNAKAREEGAEVLVDGQVLTEGEHACGNFVSPFVYRFDGYKRNTFCLREEAFSPHVAIIPVSGMEEAVDVYNDTDYGLSMAVITEDYRKWRWVRDHADYGLGYVNLPSIGAEVHLPFGGVKASGNGHPGAEGILESVTHRVAFTVNHAREIVMAQGLSTKL